MERIEEVNMFCFLDSPRGSFQCLGNEIERITIACGGAWREGKWFTLTKASPSTHITNGISTMVVLCYKIQRAVITGHIHRHAWDLNTMRLCYSQCRLDEVVAWGLVREIHHCKRSKTCWPDDKVMKSKFKIQVGLWKNSLQYRWWSCSILPWKLHSYHIERAVVDSNRRGILEGDSWRLKHFRGLFHSLELDLNSPLHESVSECLSLRPFELE